MKAYRNGFFVLLLLLFLTPSSVLAQVCDVDADGDVDFNDISQIFAARNSPATGPDDPRDADGNGVITVNDAGACVLQCTNLGCTIVEPPTDVPLISVSPDPLLFGEVLVGQSASQSLVVSNTGAATLSVSNIVSSGAPFTVTSATAFDIAAGDPAQNVAISFSPTAAGPFSGTITLSSNADNIDPVVIEVSGQGVEPANLPEISIGPDPLDFGDVFVGSSASKALVVNNTGTATLSVSSVNSGGAPFSVFPPTAFDIAAGGIPRNVDIGFSPVAPGDFSGTITFNSNAANQDPVVIAVTGRGVEPAPDLEPDIDTNNSVNFGTLAEGASVEKLLTIGNTGDAPLNVSDVISNNADFIVSALPGQSIPFILDPGETQNVSIVFTAASGSGGSSPSGQLTINSNDPDESPKIVTLGAEVTPAVTLINIPILGASVDGVIDNGNCANVSGSVKFAAHSPTFLFNVILTDQGGASASSSLFSSVSGADVAFSGIDACALDDGILELSVVLGAFDPFIGTPAIKNTSALPAPVLDPVPAASVQQVIQVCGTSRADTTVRIKGGASTVSTKLDSSTTTFCLDVPLRPNSENTLIATAIDDLAAAPKPTASADPVLVTHVDPSSIIIAEASSRPLTIEETQLLVDSGVINLDDPSNFNVSMFTIVLTIGQFPVTVSQPVAVPTSSGTAYGGGTGGWTVGGGGGGATPPRPVTGCITGCSNIVVVKTPSGQTIPGVIIIDGRIKTLKEFFQVTIAIQNTSTSFDLTDMVANVVLPAGLSPVRAGPGTDVSEINTTSATDSVDIGTIGPQQTGTGQFIIRGDGIGTHNVDVDFAGFLSGGGLAQPEPVSGSAGTSVQVFGPPSFDVVVRHPSDPAGDDVVAGEIYELIVEISNTSSRPALYTSLELFVGGQAELVDENGDPIPDSNQIVSFGTIPAGRAVEAAFRVRSSLQGEIIACQAIASENITLTVDTGPDGTACNIANTYPANFEPLPVDQPPVVIGISPLNGQPNIPVTSSVFATLTPESACIVEDTFNNIVTAPIDPNDLTKGIQVLSADLVTAGTFYLEELDPFDNPVRHIPTDLTVETPPAGGTTIAVLRLGLESPLSQFFLSPNTRYRATLVGGPGGVCSASSAAEMVSTYSWTFSTEQVCTGISAPVATLTAPPDGSTDRPLNQSITIDFGNRMNPGSFSFDPLDPLNSSFSIFQGANEAGGDISGGALVPGSAVFTNLFRTLTYTPLGNLPEDVQVHIRLTDGLLDVCGNPLQTPPNGVQLFDFRTIPPDTTAPNAPEVNPVPAITNLASIQVSGQAEANSSVSVSGGAAVVNTIASAGGLFNVAVPLSLNATNSFSVQASDASGNVSAAVTSDVDGDPLTTLQDNVRPTVVATFPVNGETGVARDVVITADFDEDIDPATINDLNFTLEGAVIPGTLAAVGSNGFSFTPDSLLEFNKTYNIRIRANGMRDLAGNGLASDFIASFTTQDFTPAVPVITLVTPDNGDRGDSFDVVFSGTGLATASTVISSNPDISGGIVSASDTSVTASITIGAAAATGPTTLGVTTAGGSASITFTVNAPAAPVITLVTPDNGDRGDSFDVVFSGTGLATASTVISSNPEISGSIVSASDTSVTASITIGASAAVGPTTLGVTTLGGSASITFTVNAVNTPPVADAGPDQAVFVGDSVSLDGSGSSDADGNPLSYAWLLTSVPSGSAAALSDPAAVSPQFVADRIGSYVARLIVNDGLANSLADTVTINATGCTINLGLVGTSLVGVGRNADVAITLSDPAPAGGRTVTLQSGNTSILGVGAGGQVTIAEGDTSGIISVNGVAEGTATLTASAPGCEAQTLAVDVTLNVITVPVTLNVLFGQTSSFPVTIGSPAPAGGQVVNLVSSDPATIGIDASVTIPEGAISANATASGLGIGQATITASATGYAADSTLAISSATIDIIEASASLTELLTTDITVQLLSSGTPIAAPAGGLVVNLTPAEPNCLAVPGQVTIPEGLVTVTVTLSYGGVATTPCTTQLTAVAPDTDADTISVTVDPPPGISLPFFPRTAAAGTIEGISFRATLGTSSHGGVFVTITSSDPTVALVAPNDTVTPGTASVDVFVPNGEVNAFYRLDAVEGGEGRTADITAVATGFSTSPAGTVTVNPLGFDIIGLNNSQTSFSVDDPFQVRLREVIGGNVTGSEVSLRAGHPGLAFTFDNSNASVAQLVTSGATGQQVSGVQILSGQSRTPSTVAAGGVAFDSLGAGTTQVSATSPGLVAGPPITVNVTAPGMTLPFFPRTAAAGTTEGSGFRAILNAPAPTDVTITIASSNPAVALVAPNDTTTPGTASVDIVVPAGQTNAFYRLDAVEGGEGQTATITATAPAGYTPPPAGTVTVNPLGFDIIGLSTTHTSFDIDDPFLVRLREVIGGNVTGGEKSLRAGHPGLTFTFDNSNASVAQLVTSGATGQQVSGVQILSGQSRTPSTVAAGGVAFDSLGAGTTQVSATSPGLVAGPPITVDLTAPGMTLPFFPRTAAAGTTEGNGFRATLDAPAPTDVTITIASSNPAVALVAPNDTTTPGTASVDIVVPAGQTNAFYRLDAVEGGEGQTATITATAPAGYTPPPAGTVTVNPLGFDIIGLSTTHSNLDADDPFQARLREVIGGNVTGSEKSLRAGHPGLTFTFDNSNASVAQLVTSGATGQQVSGVQIPNGQSRSRTPSSVAAGGVAFDSLGTGTTQISATATGQTGLVAGPAITVTVDTPTITLFSLPTIVGGGLQVNGFRVRLGAPAPAGGIDVTLAVSNAAIALIGPFNTTAAGSGNLVLSIPAGSTDAIYSIQGVPGAGLGGDQTVTLTASAPGFVDEIGTITVRQPALDILGLNLTTTAAAADDPFAIRIGIANDTGTAMQSEQVWRPDLGDLTVGVFSSNDTVGQVVTLTSSGATVNVTIPAGGSRSPGNVAGGGVALDPLTAGTTTVSASIPGFLTTNPGGNRLVNVIP